MNLISTKYHLVEQAHDRVLRPRLTKQISANLRNKLTLVAAPAGAGKTTLVQEWHADEDRSLLLAWLALDSEDNDPLLFLRYLLAAVRVVMPSITLLPEALSPLSQDQAKAFLADLLNQIGRHSQRIVLALDDYHVIENRDIHHMMNFLLDYMPNNLHLILLTRSDPPFPLSRLRVRRQLREISADDLRFTVEETQQFLNHIMALNLSTEQITTIEQRTEGWIAGVQLAALSLRGKADRASFISAFTGSNRYIADYLLEEVFNQLDVPTQDFLLHTAILDRFCADLCSTVTDYAEAEQMIDMLRKANLFVIALDDRGVWYRYHHLFADLLRLRLSRRGGSFAHLYAAASRWCEHEGLFAEAIQYAIRGQNWHDAAQLIERHSDYFWFRGELKQLLGWSDRLPQSIVESSVGLCVLKAWTMLPSGAIGMMEKYLKHAEASLDDTVNSPWYGRILSLRAFMMRIQHDGEIGHSLSLDAMAHLSPDDLVWSAFTTMNLASSAMMRGDLLTFIRANDEARTLARRAGDYHTAITSSSARAQLELDRGDLAAAQQSLQQMHEIMNEFHAQHTPMAGFIHVVSGRICYEQWDLDAAQRHFDLALKHGQEGHVADIIIDGMVWSSRVRQALGDFKRAQEVLDNLRSYVSTIDVDWVKNIADANYAHHQMLTGDLSSVKQWVAANEARIHNQPFSLNAWFYMQHLYLIKAYIHLGQSDAAAELLNRVLHLARRYGERSALLARLEVLRVLLALRDGRDADAKAILTHVLTELPVGHFRSILLEDAALLDPLLEATHPSLWPASKQEQESVTKTDPPLLGPLSDRELEVLRWLPSGLSNQGLADQLYISVNTVKWHLKEIYSKLGVSNRTEAIEKARALYLIS